MISKDKNREIQLQYRTFWGINLQRSRFRFAVELFNNFGINIQRDGRNSSDSYKNVPNVMRILCGAE